MNLLGAILYDPGTAVSKATDALLAMTALDTTNLRLTFTIPAHGMVKVHLHFIITGSTTRPTILAGVMNGATVVGRISPKIVISNTSVATAHMIFDADFIVTGLTPGSVSWDAAYGVEVSSASTNIKYGGPDNTTTADAWGAFCFEVWDPQPQTVNTTLFVDSNGRVDISKILGTAISTPATAGILDVNVKNIDNDAASASGTVTFPNATLASQTNITGGTITTVTNLTNAPTAGDLTATMKASVTTATPTTAQIADKILGRNIAGGADGTRTVTDALRANRNKIEEAAGVLTVYEEDDTTVAWTANVTRTSSTDPVTAISPI